ncbi:hypothetical protein [uncultured Tateyamaria sp.]|uniref:hypothetical protein n=1 Tax=uncultured Tateyamaria sp. TaxID=455651 RepID=UPI00260A278E|nr:hypothetical protein [uncultured Tateyamaria sp.]
MTRRSATITLHWLTFVLLILLVAGGPLPVLASAFGVTGLGMCTLAAVRGLMNGPGPALTGGLRRAHPWMSRAMYVALGVTATITIWVTSGGAWTGPSLPELHFYLLSASSLHAIFHLWRHTALGDGALRRITPKIMHGSL